MVLEWPLLEVPPGYKVVTTKEDTIKVGITKEDTIKVGITKEDTIRGATTSEDTLVDPTVFGQTIHMAADPTTVVLVIGGVIVEGGGHTTTAVMTSFCAGSVASSNAAWTKYHATNLPPILRIIRGWNHFSLCKSVDNPRFS